MHVCTLCSNAYPSRILYQTPTNNHPPLLPLISGRPRRLPTLPKSKIHMFGGLKKQIICHLPQHNNTPNRNNTLNYLPLIFPSPVCAFSHSHPSCSTNSFVRFVRWICAGEGSVGYKGVTRTRRARRGGKGVWLLFAVSYVPVDVLDGWLHVLVLVLVLYICRYVG